MPDQAIRSIRPTVDAPLLLVTAMPEEARPLLARLTHSPPAGRDATRPVVGARLVRGELARVPVALAITGTGRSRAIAGTRAALDLLRETPPARALVLGVAGGLTEAASRGSVYDCAPIHTTDLHSSSSRLADALETVTPNAPFGDLPRAQLITVDTIVHDTATKRRLRDQLDRPAAALVDMESFHVGSVLVEAGIPWGVVRAVSDGVDDELPAWLPACVDGDGQISRARVTVQALLRPWSIPRLFRMSSEVGRAARALATELERLLLASANRR